VAREDLGYRLEITMRSLASTRHPDGSLTLSSDDARDLLELLEASVQSIRAFSNLRRQLLEVINDPSHRSVTIPLSEVAAILRHERG
jgi:hypothetical protein